MDLKGLNSLYGGNGLRLVLAAKELRTSGFGCLNVSQGNVRKSTTNTHLENGIVFHKNEISRSVVFSSIGSFQLSAKKT